MTDDDRQREVRTALHQAHAVLARTAGIPKRTPGEIAVERRLRELAELQEQERQPAPAAELSASESRDLLRTRQWEAFVDGRIRRAQKEDQQLELLRAQRKLFESMLAAIVDLREQVADLKAQLGNVKTEVSGLSVREPGERSVATPRRVPVDALIN